MKGKAKRRAKPTMASLVADMKWLAERLDHDELRREQLWAKAVGIEEREKRLEREGALRQQFDQFARRLDLYEKITWQVRKNAKVIALLTALELAVRENAAPEHVEKILKLLDKVRRPRPRPPQQG